MELTQFTEDELVFLIQLCAWQEAGSDPRAREIAYALKTRFIKARDALDSAGQDAVTEDDLVKLCRRQRETIATLRQLLIDADAVARQRGDSFGLCDSVDNSGRPYQSAGSDSILQHCRMLGIRPMLSLKDLGDPVS